MSSAGPPQRRSPPPEGAPDPEWEPHRWYVGGSFRGPSLTDVLDRALDAGLVVDGDVRVDVGGIQDLITGRFRWVACSIDRTEAIGVDWWPLRIGDAVAEEESARSQEEDPMRPRGEPGDQLGGSPPQD